MNITWGEDATVKLLARDDGRGFFYVEETDPTEPTESQGRRLANTVKRFFTTSFEQPGNLDGYLSFCPSRIGVLITLGLAKDNKCSSSMPLKKKKKI